MKTYYRCDYCNFESESRSVMEEHELKHDKALEACSTEEEIDKVLEEKGFKTVNEKINYLLAYMNADARKPHSDDDEACEKMYNAIKWVFLEGFWRNQLGY